MATAKGRQAACSWSALDNATAILSWPRLPWWPGPRSASWSTLDNATAILSWRRSRAGRLHAAGVHLTTPQLCCRGHAVMATAKGRQAACSWSALDNATAMLSWPRLPWWPGPRSASPLAAGVHLTTQQLCCHSDGQGQAGCMQLECTRQRSSYAVMAMAKGRQAACSWSALDNSQLQVRPAAQLVRPSSQETGWWSG